MRPTPKPTQLSGAVFLANRRRAMLADLPRCGKTGAAVIASDYILANDILVITTSSGCGVLRARTEGFFLQRTQKDVGILEPDYEIMPLDVRGAAEAIAAPRIDARQVLKAAEDGDTKSLEMHLGPLRRLTGEIKAHAIVEAVVEEFDAGLNKIVLAYWHKDVGDILQAGLARFSPARLDGATPKAIRTNMEQAFLRNPKCRVFLGQIQAAGEAIDLSAAQNLIFVETSPVPKDMLQMGLRVTNHSQQQRPLVRVATLDGSIDDALQRILMRKWAAIREVL